MGNFAEGDYFVLGESRPRRWPAVILAAALVATLIFVPAIARAGKGGNGKRNMASTSSVAWMSVSPNPVQGGSPVYLTGCNYEVEPVEIHVVHPTGTDM